MSLANYINTHILPAMISEFNQPPPPPNSVYLPTAIQNSTQYDPQQDPYTGYLAGNWTLGDLPGSPGKEGAKNICTSVQPYGEIYIPPSGQLPYIELTDVYLKNLSQATVDSITADGPDNALYFIGKLSWGKLSAHGIKGLEINGKFKITQKCCQSMDDETCEEGTTNTQTGTGSFVMSIPSARGEGKLPIVDLSQNVLKFGVDYLKFTADTSQMRISVSIDNIPHEEAWKKHAETALNDESTLNTVIGKIQEQASKDKSQIAEALTNRIDDYMKSKHKYPYGPLK